MGLKELTADLSNFHNINQKKVDSPVGDFEKNLRGIDNSKLTRKLFEIAPPPNSTVPPSADFDRRNMYIKNSPEGSFGKFKIFRRGDSGLISIKSRSSEFGDKNFGFLNNFPYVIDEFAIKSQLGKHQSDVRAPRRRARRGIFKGRRSRRSSRANITNFLGKNALVNPYSHRRSSPVFGNTGFYDSAGRKYGDRVKFGRNLTSEKSLIIRKIYKDFEDDKNDGFPKNRSYSPFHSLLNIAKFRTTGKGAGDTADFTKSSNVGPFDINNQLGGGSSPLSGEGGFSGGRGGNYQARTGYVQTGDSGGEMVTLEEDSPLAVSNRDAKYPPSATKPTGNITSNTGASVNSSTTTYTFDEPFAGEKHNLYGKATETVNENSIPVSVDPKRYADNSTTSTPDVIVKNIPGIFTDQYGNLKPPWDKLVPKQYGSFTGQAGSGAEYRIKGSGGNVDYMDKQPFIVRAIGNRWGEEPFGSVPGDDEGLVDKAKGFLDDLAGQFVRGAPGFTGFVSRAANDVIRIAKYTASAEGISRIIKEGYLNKLNSRPETRFYNPFSVLSIIPTVHWSRHFGGSDFSVNTGIFGTISFGTDFGTYGRIMSEETSAAMATAVVAAEDMDHIDGGKVDAAVYAYNLRKYQNKFYGKVQGIGGLRHNASKLTVDLKTMTPKSTANLVVAADMQLSSNKKVGIPVKLTGDYKYKTQLVDKVNLVPYGGEYGNDKLPKDGGKDFIPFRFRDINNGKWIIFRAILSGISDTITPEWNSEKYIGRPDKVHVYTGAERVVSFNFDVYPKTVQELPVLWEKLNYLVGLCYPTFDDTSRMIAPFIHLTIGNIFHKTPGFLNSLTVTVPDGSTWEMASGLKLPKHIQCSCGFTYVGKYLPSPLGKHYELDWLQDKGWNDANSGTFHVSPKEAKKTRYPNVKEAREDIWLDGEEGDPARLWKEIAKKDGGRGTFE